MSHKEQLIKLLKTKVKPVRLAGFKDASKTGTTKISEKSKFKSGERRKRKRHLNKIQQTNSIDSNKPVIVEREQFKNESSLSDREMIINYSDSDIEISSRTSRHWINQIESNVTPSRSELAENTSTNSLTVDTIHHVYSSHTTDIFISSEDSNSNSDDDSDFMLMEDESETEELVEEVCVNYYAMKHGKVLVLKNTKPVYLHGSFKLSVVDGQLHVLGHNLIPQSAEVHIHSLRGFSYLYIQNIHIGDYAQTDNIVKNQLRKHGVSKTDILGILSGRKASHTIVVCVELNNLMLPFIEKHISQKLLPPTDVCAIIEEKSTQDVNIIKCNPQWDEIIQHIHQNSKIVVCGGKGVGKSTSLKYMINKLLITHKRVLVIDLDPGQSEFTIPGCISAVIIEEPIFGPSFTHLRKPERCIAVENIDVTVEPDKYIENSKELLNQCKALSGIPIIVNFMGYSQSYGINMASTLIVYISPTIVIQINSSRHGKNFQKDLTPQTVLENALLFGTTNATSDISYTHVIMNSMSDELTSWQARGRQTREMCILSYFSKIVNSCLSLTSSNVPLYRISLQDITLICHNSNIITNKLPVFNANLVSLCSLADQSAVYNCHGWGIIRGIDKESLVLITPETEEVLETVTHLVVTSVVLPASLLMHEDKNKDLIPYISLGCRTSFNYIPKRSYLSKRN